jgi:hypothetical protein
MPSAKPLSKLERVPLSEAWKHEAGDFTPWLAEAANLDPLAGGLGLVDPHHLAANTHQLASNTHHLVTNTHPLQAVSPTACGRSCGGLR